MKEMFIRGRIRSKDPSLEKSPFFHKVLDIFLDMVNAPGSTDGKFLFLDRIVLPLLRNIFEQVGTPTPPDSNLTAWITKTLESHVVSITVGAEEDCFMETRVPSNFKHCSPTIYWNANWLKDANNRFELGANRTDFSDIHLFELNMHLIIGVVKLIHAFVNTLINKILQYECDIKSSSSLSSSTGPLLPFPHVPPQIGSKFLNRKNNKNSLQGNPGLAAEGFLLGDGLRIKMQYISPSQFSPQYLYFEKSKAVDEQISTNTKKNGRKRKAEEALGERNGNVKGDEGQEGREEETLSLQSHIYLFRSSFEQIFTSLSYLGPLRQAMETYHSNPCPSAADAVNLYNAFSVSNTGNTLQEWNIIDTVIPKSSMARRRSLPKEEKTTVFVAEADPTEEILKIRPPDAGTDTRYMLRFTRKELAAYQRERDPLGLGLKE
jgi:hypothetical protein